ncbi:MAG: formylglycine-generating enzyme family protein [Deltaproteobacteria bacterium]|nr:formylglycine-generating enzyme family protein [Deltaproteobacteria bacterium]
MRRLLLASAVCLQMACPASSLSAPPERPVLAVFDIEVRGPQFTPETLSRLTDYLGSLMARRGYQVVPRSQLKERLLEVKRGSYRECFDESCQIEVGKELAAQKTLSAQVLKLGKKCKVALNLFDLKKSASEGAGTASGDCGEDEVVSSLEAAVKDLCGDGLAVAPGAVAGGPGAPDLSEYERLAAQAQAEEGKRLEAQKKARAEMERYLASLEKAWGSVRKVAGAKGMSRKARAGVVRKYLQDFPRDNPHEGEARAWVAVLDQDREPLSPEAGSRESMVKVPAGTMMMGCSRGDGSCRNDEKPAHEVQVSAFWMDRTEVTVAAYRNCVKAGACEPPHFDDGKCLVPYIAPMKQMKKPLPDSFRGHDHPVVCVDWSQASAYCRWAGKRLPTEAEWERAARGGTAGPYYGRIDRIAWMHHYATSPVGKKEANALGLFDMLGNVWEWCEDWYGEDYYQDSPARDPRGPATGTQRVLRGGGWDSGRYVRVSSRLGSHPGYTIDSYGFRCASSPAAGE